MLNELLPHSYPKNSCLQVFLFTCIENLVAEAASDLLEGNFKDKRFGIVASNFIKNELLDKCIQIQGAGGFLNIGSLEEILGIILKKDLALDLEIYNLKSLELSLVDLIKNKKLEHLTQCIKKETALIKDYAKKLASELINFLNQASTKLPESVEVILKTLKETFPNRIFLREALTLTKDSHDKFLFIGFAKLEPLVFTHIKNANAKLYLITPTNAFIGDVLRPKERLKFLQKIAKADEESSPEHPLLENFMQDIRGFHNELVDCDFGKDFEDEKHTSNNYLKIMQQSLKEGLEYENYPVDKSIVIKKAKTPYQECLLAIDHLQKVFSERRISQKEIVILSSKTDLYLPILNGLGSLLEHPISFKAKARQELFFHILTITLKSDIKTKNQNFLIKLIFQMQELFKDSSVLEAFKDLEKLVVQSQSAILGLSNNQIDFLSYLQIIKKEALKSLVFDVQEYEKRKEMNFLDPMAYENPENMILVLDDLILFLEKASKMQVQNQPLQAWLEDVKQLLDLNIFDNINRHKLEKILLEISCQFYTQHTDICSHLFCEIVESASLDRSEDQREAVAAFDLYEIPPKKYEVVIYLGLNDQQRKDENVILPQSVAMMPDHLFPIWLNHAKSSLYYSYLEGYPDKSEIEPHLWLQTILNMGCVLEHEGQCLLNEQFFPDSIESWDLKALEEKASELEKVTCDLDLVLLERFLKEPLEQLKKQLFSIRTSEDYLDIDLHKRHIMIWKIQNELNKGFLEEQVDFEIDSFKKIKAEEQEEKYLRSPYALYEDSLSRLKIKPKLKELGQDLIGIELYGLSSQKLEELILKKISKIKLYLYLKKLIKEGNSS